MPGPNSSIRGVVRDAEGKPVPHAIIRLTQGKAIKPMVTADPSGHYTIQFIASGTYLITAESPVTHVRTSFSTFIGRDEEKNLDLTLVPVQATHAASSPQFYDEPQFTVSGVTDTTNLGGHGSDVIVHTRDALAKDTVSLGKTSAGSSAEVSEASLRSLREHVEREPANAQLHHELADAEEKLAHPVEAVREYQRAAELDPSEPYLFDWGSELLLHHAPEPAIEVFGRGNRLFPQSARILVGLGAGWFARGSYDTAAQKMCEASDINPTDPMPYLFLGRVDRVQKATSDEAVKRFRRFAMLHPENAAANYYYAVSLWKRRKNAPDVAEIKSLLKATVKLDPKFSPAYLQLGIVHSENREFATAITYYTQAIRSDPQSEEAHFRLAQAYRQTGDAERAKAETTMYEHLAKESSQKTEAERHEIQQFVYTLRDYSPTATQKP